MNFQEALSRTLDYLRSNKLAYVFTFRRDQPANMAVLRDLAKFCRANETAAVPGDHDRTWALIGRREVFLHITQYMNLTPEELYDLYGGPKPPQQRRTDSDE
jgi:hypothetical protein